MQERSEHPQPLEVEPRAGFRIWIRYRDAVAGEIDLSDLAGKGVFRRWNGAGAFERVRLANGGISWNDDLDLYPDALNLRLTGRSPADLFHRLRIPGEES